MDTQTRKVLTQHMERLGVQIMTLSKQIDNLQAQINEADDAQSALKKVLRREVVIDYDAWEYWKSQPKVKYPIVGAGGGLTFEPHVYEDEPSNGLWRVYAGEQRFPEWDNVPAEFVTVIDTPTKE